MSALPVSSSDPMPAFRIPCQQWSGAPLVNQQQSLAMQLLVGQITAQISICISFLRASIYDDSHERDVGHPVQCVTGK